MAALHEGELHHPDMPTETSRQRPLLIRDSAAHASILPPEGTREALDGGCSGEKVAEELLRVGNGERAASAVVGQRMYFKLSYQPAQGDR